MQPYSSRAFQRYQEHGTRHHCMEALNMTTKQQMKTRGVSHCSLAIYIKKYLKAYEEVWKLMLSPTSINEKITYVYILKAKNSTPNLTSHQHPQVKLIARVSVAGVSPAHHWVWRYITCQSSQHILKLGKH